MDKTEFVDRMNYILDKASDASDMDLTWHVVSADPDVVADFGCDSEGNLVIDGRSLPTLKLEDLTNIRYRFNPETDDSDCFIRFDFGLFSYLDVCFSDCEFAHMLHASIRERDIRVACKSLEEMIECLNE